MPPSIARPPPPAHSPAVTARPRNAKSRTTAPRPKLARSAWPERRARRGPKIIEEPLQRRLPRGEPAVPNTGARGSRARGERVLSVPLTGERRWASLPRPRRVVAHIMARGPAPHTPQAGSLRAHPEPVPPSVLSAPLAPG